jgi:hypothetical protein
VDALLPWNREEASLQPFDPSPVRSIQEEAWLLGQPPLRTYLDYVRHTAIGGSELASSKIVDEWRSANDYYAELETREAGLADRAEIFDLDSELRPLADEVMTDSRWRRAFTSLPTQFAMVELDCLIVSQQFVNLTHAERLKQRLGSSPLPKPVFEFCFPLDRAEAPVRMRRAGSHRYLFWSESSDFRFHEPAVLEACQIKDYEAYGALGGVIGLMVGYGSNFLSAIRSDNRLLLNNGHHRAYALRSLGLKHAPCIIQTVTRRDELGIVAPRNVLEDPAFYFKAARPPLLKDFFDPKLRKVLQIPKTLRMVELSFEAKEIEIVDFAEAG